MFSCAVFSSTLPAPHLVRQINQIALPSPVASLSPSQYDRSARTCMPWPLKHISPSHFRRESRRKDVITRTRTVCTSTRSALHRARNRGAKQTGSSADHCLPFSMRHPSVASSSPRERGTAAANSIRRQMVMWTSPFNMRPFLVCLHKRRSLPPLPPTDVWNQTREPNKHRRRVRWGLGEAQNGNTQEKGETKTKTIMHRREGKESKDEEQTADDGVQETRSFFSSSSASRPPTPHMSNIISSQVTLGVEVRSMLLSVRNCPESKSSRTARVSILAFYFPVVNLLQQRQPPTCRRISSVQGQDFAVLICRAVLLKYEPAENRRRWCSPIYQSQSPLFGHAVTRQMNDAVRFPTSTRSCARICALTRLS